jgi:hypothetical protein
MVMLDAIQNVRVDRFIGFFQRDVELWPSATAHGTE